MIHAANQQAVDVRERPALRAGRYFVQTSALRALVLTAAALLFINAALPGALALLYPIGYRDGRVSPEFAQFDPLSVEEMLSEAARAGGRNVFWIGDSIVHGRVAPNGDSPRLLQDELQRAYGADIHVFNAAMPAARTADKYAVLLRVLQHHPAAVIFEMKYLEFSRAQVEGVPFRYPYLNKIVAADPAYAARYSEFNRYAETPLEPPASAFDVGASIWLDRLVSVARFRALLNESLFGGDLFSRLSGAPPDLLLSRRATEPPGRTCANQANPVTRKPAAFTPAYRSGRFDAFPNAGLFFADRALEALGSSHVPAIAYLASINHALVGSLADDGLFRSNLALIRRIIARHHVPFTDENAALGSDTYFIDTEHLTTCGHVAMIRRILGDDAAVFRTALQR